MYQATAENQLSLETERNPEMMTKNKQIKQKPIETKTKHGEKKREREKKKKKKKKKGGGGGGRDATGGRVNKTEFLRLQIMFLLLLLIFFWCNLSTYFAILIIVSSV